MPFLGESAKEKKIADVNEEDFIVWIEGMVISKGEGKMVVDDGSATVEVYATPAYMDDVKENDYVRVIGRVFPTPSGIEIHADIIRKLEIKDLKTYMKARELWLKFNTKVDEMIKNLF